MAVNKPVNLLELAIALDPRFGQNMPQEVADAFASGDIQRLIRTSKDMPGTTPDLRTPAQGGRAADQFGNYTGSIYAQHKDGRIARFKNPEVAAQGDDMRHAGWNARTAGIKGRSAFFDQAHVIPEDSFTQVGSPERIAFDKAKALNPKLSGEQIAFALARQGHSIATPTTAPASDIMGKQIFETMKVGSTDADPRSTHKGDMVSDIFEATGERHYFAGTTTSDQKSARGSAQVEPIESYMTRKGATATTAAVPKTAEPVKPVESKDTKIKVGKPVEKAEETAKKTTVKTGKPIEKVDKKAEEVSKERKAESSFDEDDKGLDSEEDGESVDVVSDAFEDIKDVAESEGTLEEALTEKAKEKIKDKIDPVKKIEKSIGKKVEDIKEGLLDTVMDSSNAERAKRLASADPTPVTTKTSGMLNRLINASGRAPGSADTLLQKGAREAVNVINKPGITRELLESGGDIARAIAGGTKNSKNLRLAGAATLLSAAGYGIGKVKNRKADVNKEQLKFDPDEEAALRQSLLNDG